MRALGRCLLIAAILASAQGASAVEKRPTAAEEAEIRGLEKELTGLQIKQAYLAAIPIARKLYELQREATGADSRAARSRQNVLGTMLQSAGRTTDALVIYEEMLRTAEAQYGRASRETMQSLGSINSVYWSQSRYDDAYPVMQRMLEITRKLDGEQSQMYANQLSQLGTLFNMRSEFSAAHTAVFQQAIKDSTKLLDPSVLTHVTRLHEIEADREGMVMAFLAGYQPRGGIEFMELMGKQREIPKHLDHPTFQERIDYLTDFWTNDVRYAFVSFKLGVAAMDRGDQLEESDLPAAVAAYQAATEHFKRFHTMLPSLKEAMNDLGVAYTKLGVLAMDRNDSPLGRWQTRFSLERESSVKYADLVGDEGARHSRGLDRARLPSQLRDAIASFKEALADDEDYNKARLNLAAAYLAAGQLDNASAMLGKIVAQPDVTSGDVELLRGVAFAEAKEYEAARLAFEHAEGFPANRRAALYNRAKAMELGGKKADAKKAYQQYAVVFPGGPWAKAAETAAAKL
jgi:tetratricopeptide (TPR) repeat protein